MNAHLPALTSTRFLAAFVVLLGHFADLLAMPGWLQRLISGGIGVSFFFVLSGFILTYRYGAEFQSRIEKAGYWRYFAARIARVYPSYLLALLLMTALLVTVDGVKPGAIRFPDNPLASWLTTALALHTFAPSIATQQFWNAPGWSISTEFGFYLTFPFILALIARTCRNPAKLTLALAAIVAIAAILQAAALYAVFQGGWSQAFWVDKIASRNIVWRLPEFVTGVVAARLLFDGHLPAFSRHGVRNAALLAGVVVVVGLNMAPWPSDPDAAVFMRQFRLGAAYMLPFALVIVALGSGETLGSRILGHRWFIELGEASYGVYIYHWLTWTALTLMKAAGHPPSLAMVVMSIFATVAFAIVSYRWFERPARRSLRTWLAPGSGS